MDTKGRRGNGLGENPETTAQSKKKKGIMIEGYPVEGLSIGGQETCVIFPTLKIAFDIGRCPQRAISQEFLFISHGHMDHIGGLPMYVATRGLYKMRPPTIIVPTAIKENVERLFEVHRAMDQSELKHNLISLNVGEEFQLRKDLKVKAFKTYHAIPSQITYTVTSPEIAFTGDTMSDFIIDPSNIDVLRSKILVMESTFVDNSMTVDNARDYGHTHLSEIVSYADKFENQAILLIHFSARYQADIFKLQILSVKWKDKILKLALGLCHIQEVFS
ncbi:PREDICTED: nuclear ribonuclease Z isoform X5 [Nelumbo nucifera]|uniref:Nuclear ribonuclease Z isoform X5 n=1 Tax=Nelumbo nucifera TaxID=4432 RepID=A0A1U7Z899_NELNU|nr:PREDICTED: nuclear ribonuclease Z isoform X5 [Nelumbo nucifera]